MSGRRWSWSRGWSGWSWWWSWWLPVPVINAAGYWAVSQERGAVHCGKLHRENLGFINNFMGKSKGKKNCRYLVSVDCMLLPHLIFRPCVTVCEVPHYLWHDELERNPGLLEEDDIKTRCCNQGGLTIMWIFCNPSQSFLNLPLVSHVAVCAVCAVSCWNSIMSFCPGLMMHNWLINLQHHRHLPLATDQSHAADNVIISVIFWVWSLGESCCCVCRCSNICKGLRWLK